MICIRITECEDGVELSAHGHAGYAPRGQDVVCAGVSALLYGLKAYLEEEPSLSAAEDPRGDGSQASYGIWEGDGEVRIRIVASSPAYREAVAVVIAGLGLMARVYPAYVTLDMERRRV